MAEYRQLIDMRSNGRFALSWLAAKNPRAFENYVKKGHLESVDVSLICEELMKLSNDKKISMRMASDLAFGIIKVHSKLADNILKDAAIAQNISSSNIFQIPKEKPQKTPKKKSNAPKKQMSEEEKNDFLIDEINNFICSITPHPEELCDLPVVDQTLANELISLHEIELPTQSLIELDPDESFGELNTQQANDILNFIEDVVDRDHVHPNVDVALGEGTSRDFLMPRSPLATSSPIPFQVKTSPSNQEVSSIRSLDFAMPNVQDAHRPEEIPEIGQRAPEEGQVEPSGSIPDIEDRTDPPAAKKRKKTLAIDDVIVIPNAKIRHQLENYADTMRCSKSKEDIYDFRTADRNLLWKPSRKRLGDPLNDLYNRNCKSRRVEEEFEDILTDILTKGNEANNNMQDIDTILKDFNDFGNKRATRKRKADTAGILPPEIPPLEMPPPPVPRDFQEIPPEQTNLQEFTKEPVLAKLQVLWQKQKEPVTMECLLDQVTCKKSAARTFMSLLELSKLKKVQLHTKDGSHEIASISLAKN
ncbi:uncharacterized protein LOC129808328 [Phlebotomus papatasi]|uniref:Rad21/Rec8-like protein N-terminal domain-containing protein n=1 Tax=Phlebotomus papatasi TaxID=29031 RepID=A0A1B0GMN6_PHLPP|nr:uncharacterized protein LOC129808328 [Phlebotomus papatasi]